MIVALELSSCPRLVDMPPISRVGAISRESLSLAVPFLLNEQLVHGIKCRDHRHSITTLTFTRM